MKKILFLVIFLHVFAVKLFAQQFNAAAYKKHLGKTGTLCDTVKSFKLISDTLALLNMGGIYPHQKYTIAVRGNKINLDWIHLKGKNICVTGVFELHNNRPQITVAQPYYIHIH
ncbi:MAG: hypothetical protein JWR67_1865 [Mucilaginibacter sp.]|nr:hypothetical protein [Mucilaginibacter sp.]